MSGDCAREILLETTRRLGTGNRPGAMIATLASAVKAIAADSSDWLPGQAAHQAADTLLQLLTPDCSRTFSVLYVLELLDEWAMHRRRTLAEVLDLIDRAIIMLGET